MRCLSVGRLVRRAIHRQHHGLRLRGDRPGAAGLGRNAGAVFESRDAYAEASGKAVMELMRRGLRPRDIVTRKALENAAMVVAATGGSTNAGLHLPAIAHEAGIDFDLHAVGEIFKRTPYIGDFKPGGRYVMKDLHDIGGVPVLMKALLDGGYLHGDCITVTGKTIAENLRGDDFPANQDVVRPTAKPLVADRRRRRAEGQSRAAGRDRQSRGHAEHGAQIPRAGALLRYARRTASPAVEKRQYKEGDVLVIRYEGPRGGPGMREMLATTAALYGQGIGDKVALITDGRFSGAHARLLHRPCRAGGGGRRADRAVADGDMIAIDAVAGTLVGRALSDAELAERRAPGSRARPTTSPARCGNTRRPSAMPRRARSPIRAARPRPKCYADI